MLIGPPLYAQQRLAQPGPRGVIFVSGHRNGCFIFELKTIAPAVIEVKIRYVVAGMGRVVVGHKAEIDLQMPVAWCARIIGDKWWAALRARQGRTYNRGKQQEDWNESMHSNDRALR